MNALSSLWEKLSRSKKYRESFVASVAKRMIPIQIRALRKQHIWSQAILAKESNLTQGAISRAEDPDYGNLTVNTLVRIAAGFDCAFIGRFVPFSEFVKWYTNLDDEKALHVPSFIEDDGFMEQPVAMSSAVTRPESMELLLNDSTIKRKPVGLATSAAIRTTVTDMPTVLLNSTRTLTIASGLTQEHAHG